MATTRGTRRDFAALEARRMDAARLFARKVSQNEVARRLGVSVAAAHRWFHAWQEQGRRGLKAAGRAGRKPRLDQAALARVERALRQGAPAHGFATDLWTLPRVATLIERHVERLPAYAPDLNPVEQIWGNVKGRDLANLCPTEILALRRPLRGGFARIRRHPDLAVGFLRHAGLNL